MLSSKDPLIQVKGKEYFATADLNEECLNYEKDCINKSQENEASR